MKPFLKQLLLVIVFFYSTLALGQTTPNVRLYLKNGSVVHGKILGLTTQTYNFPRGSRKIISGTVVSK